MSNSMSTLKQIPSDGSILLYFFKGWICWGSGEVRTTAAQSTVLSYVLHLSRDKFVPAFPMLIRCGMLDAVAVCSDSLVANVASGCSSAGSCTNAAHQCQGETGGERGHSSFTSSFSFFWAPSSRIQLLALVCWTPPNIVSVVWIFCQISDLKRPVESSSQLQPSSPLTPQQFQHCFSTAASQDAKMPFPLPLPSLSGREGGCF